MKRFFSLLLTISLLIPQFGFAQVEDVYTPDNSLLIDPLMSSKHLQRNFKVGEFTGAAIYDYPIGLPAGRNGMTPSVKLTYNSQDSSFDNLVGYRWNINTYSIRRFNKVGVEAMYDRNDFVANTPFDSGELIALGGNLYGQKVEQAFGKYERQPDNSWLVTDKHGTTYIFGANEATRQFDPENPDRTFRWMLEEVRDRNDNFIRYTYHKVDNQIYPKTITYTGHGEDEGIFEVKFLPFANGQNGTRREDRHFGYSRGFLTETNYLIDEIEVWVNGNLRREYQISYTTVEPLIRQTIGQIAETGYSISGQATSLPPTRFEYTPSSVSWSSTNAYEPDWIFEDCYYVCTGASSTFQWDMTGDGLDDFEVIIGGTGRRAVNNGNGDWELVDSHFLSQPRQPGEGIPSVRQKVLDFDGDLLPDFIQSSHRVLPGSVAVIDSSLLKYDGTQFSNILPIAMAWNDAHSRDNGVSIGDLNGDGLPDLIQRRKHYYKGPLTQQTCLNRNGEQCELTSLWPAPSNIIEDRQNSQYPRRALVQDCNHDGLADFKVISSGTGTYINDGKGGWVLLDSNDQSCFFNTFDTSTNRSMDANGDGLMDRAHSYTIPTNAAPSVTNYLNLNTGNDFVDFQGIFPFQFGSPSSNNQFHADYGVRVVDLNGDLLPDLIQSLREGDTDTGFQTNTRNVYLNNGSRPYFLKTVHTKEGGRMDFEYKTSAQYVKSDGSQANPKLPIIVTTLTRETMDPGKGPSITTDYFYEDGHYFYESTENREFAGFRVVTKTDSEGFQTKTYFHQGENSIADESNGEYEDRIGKKGIPYRTEIIDNNGSLIQATINKVDFNGRQPVITRSTTALYDTESGIPHASAIAYEYDDYGNRTKVVDFGEVTLTSTDGQFNDVGDDYLEGQTDYVQNLNDYLVGLPIEKKQLNQHAQLLTHQRFLYDELPLGEVAKGNLTQSETWINTNNQFITSRTTYNEFGLPISQTNPRGYTTTYAYDAENLYVSEVVNPLGHQSRSTIDVGIGQLMESVDPNGLIKEYRFDGLGRLVESKQTDPNGGAMLTMQTMEYFDTQLPRGQHATVFNDDGNSVESYGYLDGFGRPIQSKAEGQNGMWTTTGNLFDSRGNLLKEIQPYFSSQSGYEAISNDQLGTQFEYDVLKRPIRTIDPVGTTTISYDGWNKTVTDANGNTKGFRQDSRGNLIGVTENIDGNDFLTSYMYDPLSRLTKITDAMGNIRDFSYDSVGRRLSQTDAHQPGDQHGLWQYQFDENGNLKRRTDPLNQVISYTYDALDRQLQEDFANSPGVDLSFEYDHGDFGIGRLNKVSSKDYSRQLNYDLWGRLLGEQKEIESHVFAFQFQYDQLGAVTQMTYPDGSVMSNHYDESHRLERVEADGRLFADQINYNPLDQVTQIRIGGQMVTTNTYDPEQLFRLMSKKSGDDLQHFGYQYDAVGNMTSYSDNSLGATIKAIDYTYDTINRLTGALHRNETEETLFDLNYQYDPIGNMIFKTDLGVMEYNHHNPHALTKAGDLMFEYDKSGRQIKRGEMDLVYDYRDRMVMSGNNTEYSYDEGNIRLKKENLETGNKRFYPSKYYEIDTTEEIRFVYAGDLKIAKMVRTFEVPEETPDEPTEESEEDPTEEPADEPTEDPIDEPDLPPPPPEPAPTNVAQAVQQTVRTNKNNGGNKSRRADPSVRIDHFEKKASLFRIKRPVVVIKSDQIDSQTAKRPKLPKAVRPKPLSDEKIEFKNLQIAYHSKKAVLKWDEMDERIKSFGIYRSKRAYPSTASKHAGTKIAEIPAKSFKNLYVDDEIGANERYSYRITALDEDGNILATSIKLHSRQIFVHPKGEWLIDLEPYGVSDFNKVVLKKSKYFEYKKADDPFKFRIQPSYSQVGAKIEANFLNCQPTEGGKDYCVKTENVELEVYTIKKPRLAERIENWWAGMIKRFV